MDGRFNIGFFKIFYPNYRAFANGCFRFICAFGCGRKTGPAKRPTGFSKKHTKKIKKMACQCTLPPNNYDDSNKQCMIASKDFKLSNGKSFQKGQYLNVYDDGKGPLMVFNGDFREEIESNLVEYGKH